MIRFRRITGFATPYERRRLPRIERLLAPALRQDGSAIDTVEAMLRSGDSAGFEPVLLVAENGRGQVTGAALACYFPDLRLAWLHALSGDPARSRSGVGAAVYEALREVLAAKGARGLLLEVAAGGETGAGGHRLRFHEQYGARALDGVPWRRHDAPAMLVLDPLGREARLRRATARKAIGRVASLTAGAAGADGLADAAQAALRHDPVALRAPARPSLPAPARGTHLVPLKLVVAERHEIHHLKEKGYVERPARVAAILRGLEALPHERMAITPFEDRHVLAVHDARLLAFLARARDELPPQSVIYAELFPPRHRNRLPQGLAEQAGYFSFDTYSPVTASTYDAARAAADCALTGARQLLEGERLAYALCRPPGHHAERGAFGGFCFLNNAAIAAHYLSRRGRVALLDIDFHHGNGSQEIFYRRRDVLTVSLHGDPNIDYPNFAGFADETGQGAGAGFNLNLPLPPGTDDEAYLAALDAGLDRIRAHDALFLVVSLGFDIMAGDPTGNFLVTARAMQDIGRRIGALRLATLVVQEGGYSLRNLRRGAHGFFSGLAKSWY